MGRPVGSKDKKPRRTPARKQAAALALNGITPLDFMLDVMRQQHRIWRDPRKSDEERKAAAAFGVHIAEKAAPYFSAKLAPIASVATDERRLIIEFSPDEPDEPAP